MGRGRLPVGVPPHELLACRLADALYRAGDAAGAAEVRPAALAHVTRPDSLVELHWTLAQCRASDGRSEESLAALERALQDPQVGPRDRARLLVLTARAHRSLGHVDAAGQVADDGARRGHRGRRPVGGGWALGVLTFVHGMRGETTKALPLFDRALAVANGDPALADLRLLLQINQAVALGDLDRYDAAISAARAGRGQLADEPATWCGWRRPRACWVSCCSTWGGGTTRWPRWT